MPTAEELNLLFVAIFTGTLAIGLLAWSATGVWELLQQQRAAERYKETAR